MFRNLLLCGEGLPRSDHCRNKTGESDVSLADLDAKLIGQAPTGRGGDQVTAALNEQPNGGTALVPQSLESRLELLLLGRVFRDNFSLQSKFLIDRLHFLDGGNQVENVSGPPEEHRWLGEVGRLPVYHFYLGKDLQVIEQPVEAEAESSAYVQDKVDLVHVRGRFGKQGLEFLKFV